MISGSFKQERAGKKMGEKKGVGGVGERAFDRFRLHIGRGLVYARGVRSTRRSCIRSTTTSLILLITVYTAKEKQRGAGVIRRRKVFFCKQVSAYILYLVPIDNSRHPYIYIYI